MLCCITLFAFSYRFVDAQVVPKWLGVMLCVGVMGIVWSIAGPKIKISPLRYLFGTVAVFALVLSLHGIILQLAGVMPAGKAIGNFDNPAGFASALACAFPLCFLFFKSRTLYVRYVAVATAAIIATAVSFSGSRAGMLAVAVATVVWLLAKIRNRTTKIILLVALAVLPAMLYFFKKDSADGRLLIWRCALDMVAESPVAGHGLGAFRTKYMLYQAAYFNANLDSQYAQLADNVQHPFNEYLLVATNYGMVGLGVVALLMFLLTRAYRQNNNPEKIPAMLSLLALAVFSFFSYPFRYPFTWILLFINVAVICYPIIKKQLLKIKSWIPLRVTVCLLSAGLLTYTVMLTRAEITWKRIANLSLMGRTVEMLPEYEKLYQCLGKNGHFLYNYAAELHEAKEYKKSLAIFEQCTRYFNDMDVQLLLASNYKKLGKYTEAEQHLKTASHMCPSRFIPLYELVKLYSATDRKYEAQVMAQIIIDKDVKISTPTITIIKDKMWQLLDARRSIDTVLYNRKPKSSEIWQDKIPP
jgi:O-antigen ligase